MSGYGLPRPWTVGVLRDLVLLKQPWENSSHGLNVVIQLIVGLIRENLGPAAQGEQSLFGRVKSPADFLTVFRMIGADQPWLAGPEGNVWSKSGAGYSPEVLNFAAGLTRNGLKPQRRYQYANHPTRTGALLFEEFTDLWFDVGLPTARAIGAYRRAAETRVLPPPGVVRGPLRGKLRSDCFKGQGASDLTRILRDVVTSHDQVAAVEEDPVEALTDRQWEEVLSVFVQVVLRKLDTHDAHDSELGQNATAPFREHIKEQFGITHADTVVTADRRVSWAVVETMPTPERFNDGEADVAQGISEISDDAESVQKMRDLTLMALEAGKTDRPGAPEDWEPPLLWVAASEVAAAAHIKALAPGSVASWKTWDACVRAEAQAYVTENPGCGFPAWDLAEEAQLAYAAATLGAGRQMLEHAPGGDLDESEGKV